MNVLPLLRKVLAQSRIVRSPIIFSEESFRNTCEDTPLSDSDDCLALRILANDHLKLLKGSPGQVDGYCNLPDYIVVREERETVRGSEIIVVKVLLAEMKSSEASLELALRQLQLGAILVPYLCAAARLDFAIATAIEIRQCAILISPNLPQPKGRTRRSKTEYEYDTLTRVGIPRYDVPCGADVSFDEFEYWKSDI